MHILLCHENADFDAVAALLAAFKLNPGAIPVLPERHNANVTRFLALYRGGLPFVARADLRLKHVEQITLVDTQRVPPIKGVPANSPVHIIDHHPLGRALEPHETFTGEIVGAVTTLLVEQIEQQALPLTSLEATLLALGIYEDTGSLTYGSTTARDLRAAAWLVDQGAALDDVRRFLEPPLSDEQQALLERLIPAVEARSVQGYTVIVATAKLDSYLNEISAVAHRLRDTLDPAGLFLLVQMPGALHLVCRSTDDAIDAGAVARFFGGGGHERAAAATIHEGYTLDQAVTAVWQQLEQIVRPAVRVADLMSHGAQTLDADLRLDQVVRKLRRIGHEGYPVLDHGRIVGLLTRRDADRAVEHGLGDLTVREVMTAGEATLKPEDSVKRLEQRMVESGWGQLPVVNDDGRLIGIVTRTDLIKHWTQTHLIADNRGEFITRAQMAAVLGDPVTQLIDTIAQQAQDQPAPLYLVGGVVRDLLLKRRNFDIDFVVEGDAIRFAESLQARYGGRVHSHRPFGTANWVLSEAVIDGLNSADLPDHVDFATARNEFYEHPTALPTTYSGSIKLDLLRRDFTINTLAITLSPASGRVLDFYGGLADLEAQLIRVLHSLSFVDDPTRILRAVRFERRLGFQIEPRTAELIATALPMLRRITGERVRHELTLLLGEADPAASLLLLQQRAILTAIHPAFIVPDDLAERFARAQAELVRPLPWPMPAPDRIEVYWCLTLANIPPQDLTHLAERLLFSKTLTTAVLATAQIVQNLDGLTDPATPPSQITARLTNLGDLALYSARLIVEDNLARQRIGQYANEWRAIRPVTDGHSLRARGLTPGPCYARILTRLRAARLDGLIVSDADERAHLQKLLEEGICDDDPG